MNDANAGSGGLETEAAPPRYQGSAREVFIAFLRLGLTSFGGPVAHLGYFRVEFVERRCWLGERSYGDIVALSQFLPGPGSSQTGFAIGVLRAGYWGGIAAWMGFTLPSAALMLLFALGAGSLADVWWGVGLLHGLKLVAVAIVAQAVLGMARSLCPDGPRATIAVVALILVAAIPGSFGQILAILAGGALGLFVARGGVEPPEPTLVPVSRRFGAVCLALFLVLLLLAYAPSQPRVIALFDAFYRSGALVFGGGHVVLPLLRDAVIAPGWVSENDFLAGYGAAQAVPGPLFTFAAYLGAVASGPTKGAVGSIVALIGIFLPGVLLLMCALPFWAALRSAPAAQAFMRGVNASVVGLLALALYNPVWTSAVSNVADFTIVVAAFVMLIAWKAPPLLVVVASAAAGVALAALI